MRWPVAREGLPFFLPPLLAGVALLAVSGSARVVGVVLVVLGVLVALFFRDPERTAGGGPRSVVSPADGRVVRLVRRADGATELSIFLSPLDVHVNRSPVAGRLVAAQYRPGRFHPAYHGAASHENERIDLRIESALGVIDMREITGVLVRRIVVWKKPGDALERGERIGVMKFGSRIDLVLPPGVEPRVGDGSRVRAAETVIAEG